MIVTIALLSGGLAPAAPPRSDALALTADVAALEYAYTLVDGRATAPNRAQGLRSTLEGAGVRVVPREADPATDAVGWELGLRLVAWGRGEELAPAPVSGVRASGERAELDRGGLLEWLVNRPEGVEHGFTIAAPPSAPREEAPLVLRLAVEGGGTASVTADGLSARFRFGTDEVLRYRDLLVLDADGARVPARLVATAEGIEVLVEDRGARYPLEVDPTFTNPAWALQGNQIGASLGASVQTAGDVNGDGFSDVVVGAPGFATISSDEGRIFVYHGTASGVSFNLAWSWSGDFFRGRLGESVSTAGDVDGDGYDDIVVGEPGFTNGHTREGRVHLFRGSPSGISGGPAWQYEADSAFAEAGRSVASAGDVDRDGHDDVLVGAPGTSSSAGRASLFRGSSAGLLATAAWSVAGVSASDLLGFSVSGAGDLNGDGYDDVIVGVPNRLISGTLRAGNAHFYLGSASGPSTIPIVRGASSFDTLFGTSVARAGDIDGDGYADALVGEPNYGSGQTEEGRALLYRGGPSGPSGAPAWTMEANQIDAHCGRSVSTAGDVNGDGYADVIVGAPGDPVSGVAGRAWVFHGSAAGIASPHGWFGWSPSPTEYGISVATAGDVDGDGFSEILVGGPGYSVGESHEGGAWVYHGAGSRMQDDGWTHSVSGSAAGTFFGFATTIVGDVNGDGIDEFAVGAPYEDGFRGYLRVYSGDAGLAHATVLTRAGEAQENYYGFSVDGAGDVNGDGYDDLVVGAPFYDGAFNNQGRVYVHLGSPAGLSAAPSWSFDGDQESAKLGFSVSGGGDQNGDGYADVLVGVPTDDGLGRVFLFLGSPAGLGSTPDWVAENGDVDGQFGYAVDGEGDVNGDGFSDVLVGGPDVGYPGGSGQAGKAYLYLGTADGPYASHSWALTASFVGHLGEAVAFVGDVNADGYSDAVVGAPWQAFGQQAEGRAMLYLGHPTQLLTSPAWAVEGNLQSAWFGTSVAGVGDVDGDGFDDFVVGAPNWNQNGLSGRAFFFRGAAGVPSTNPAWQYSPPSNDWIACGYGVSGGGDVNGDGFPDFLLGMPTYVHTSLPAGRTGIFYGNGKDSAPPELDRRPRQMRLDGSVDVGLLGRAQPSHGFELALVGRSPAGREHVGVQWEVKPLGTPFTGLGLGSAPLPYDTGAPGSDGSRVDVREDVLGLLAFHRYHWRARLVSRNPFFPRSPWLSAAGNGQTELKLRTPLEGAGSGRTGPKRRTDPM